MTTATTTPSAAASNTPYHSSQKHQPVECSTVQQFESVLASNVIHVLNFWAPWAEQCTGQMNAVFAELCTRFHGSPIGFISIEAEQVAELSERFSIEAVPTFVFVDETGKELERVAGADAAKLTRSVEAFAKQALLKEGIQQPATNTQTTASGRDDLNKRLVELTTMAPVVLFMKGSPLEPKCGFSRQIVALLAEQRVAYTSFDILTDSEVRQGLKEFSQWPTYPQLWIDGELVGGLDIVKELIESNEFQAMLPKAAGSKDDGSSGDDLNSRLLRLINRSDLMVFIKGTPDAPQCGFSRQLVDLLNDLQAKFDYFNILSDEQVRQGLKEFSQWPTYPQVYHKGELLGGLDICKEMIEAGEFQQLISE